MSHLNDVKIQDLKAQARLLGFADRNSDWYAMRQFGAGVNWLAAHYGYDPRLEQALAADTSFWAWWKNGWRQRDTSMSSRLKVVSTGVLTYTVQALSERGGGATIFFHECVEFRDFYLAQHCLDKLAGLRVPKPVLEGAARTMRAETQARLTELLLTNSH